MNEERVQTRLQALEARIAAKENEIAETRLAIQAAESKEDSWLLKQQVTQLITQLTYLLEERKRLFDLLYPPPATVSAPAPLQQQPVPSSEQNQQQYATLAQDVGMRLLRRELNDMVHSQPQPTSAPPPQPVETICLRAYLSPRMLEFIWTKVWGDNFPRGMKTGIKNIAHKYPEIKWRVQHTSPRMVEKKRQHSVLFAAWGELPTLYAIRKDVKTYAGNIGCAASSFHIIPDISYRPDKAECDIVPTRCGTLNSDGSGKEHEEQASSCEPAPVKHEKKSADTRSFAQKLTVTKEQAQQANEIMTKLSEFSDVASEMAKSIASPETSDRIMCGLKQEQPPKNFIKITVDGVFRLVFGVVPTSEYSPIKDIVWDLQYYLFRETPTKNMRLNAHVLTYPVDLDEAAINVVSVDVVTQ